MSSIKKILHKYLNTNALKLFELNGKLDDFVWLEKQGYYIRREGKLTSAGERYIKKHNELVKYYADKINDDSLDSDKIDKLRDELKSFISQNPNIDVDEGLNETERFAFHDIYYSHW